MTKERPSCSPASSNWRAHRHRSRWVLYGQADLREELRPPHIRYSPASVQAVLHALEVAGVTLDDIDFFDFYSCFPIAVFNVIDGLKLAADDPRGLTVTGGLPFFGGPGNNYSMHAIAEIVRRVRTAPGSLGLVEPTAACCRSTR